MRCPNCARPVLRATVVGDAPDHVILDSRDYWLGMRDVRDKNNRPRVYRVLYGRLVEQAHASPRDGQRDGPFKRPHVDVCEHKARQHAPSPHGSRPHG